MVRLHGADGSFCAGAAKDGVAIMAGSGVSPDNMVRLHEEAGVKHFHMSGKKILASRMEYRKENVPIILTEFYKS